MNDVLVAGEVEPRLSVFGRPVHVGYTAAAGIAALVVFAARLWTSRGRDEYAIWPDEPSQLAIARYIGGGTRWNMYDHSVWRPLFGTLLAPVYLFTDDPQTVFHTALVLNAVLGGIAAALLVVIARRLTAASAAWCAALAVIVSLVPGAIFTTDFVFAESLLVPLYLATLLALFRFRDHPSTARGIAAGVAAAAAFATHSRMLPLSLVVAAVTVHAAVRHRLALRSAVAVVAATIASVYLASAYTAFIVDRLWREPSNRNSIGGVIEQFGNGSAVVVSALGQIWYLLVASLGIVAYGVIVLMDSARPRPGPVRPTRADARLLLLTVAVCLGLSIVFMSDRWRSDQLVYGRYNEAVIGPVLVVGLAALIGVIPMHRVKSAVAGVSVAVLASGSLLWALRSEVLSDSNGLEPMILGLQPFMTSATTIDVVRISVWAAGLTAGLGVLAVVARRRAVALLIVVAIVVVLGWARTRTIVDQSWDDSGDISAVAELRRGPLTDGVPVDFFLPRGNTATNRMMAYQFHLPRTEFTVVHDIDAGALAGSSSTLLFARIDGDGLREAGATLIWRDPRGRYGLWER